MSGLFFAEREGGGFRMEFFFGGIIRLFGSLILDYFWVTDVFFR